MTDTAKRRISDEAVRQATGKTWDQWLAILDREGAREMGHKDIVRLLHDKGYIESAWWQQTVASGYETARGLRVTGESASAGFKIGARRTFQIDSQQAWELVTGPVGARIWLGHVSKVPLSKGETYQTADGTRGEVRSFTPGRRLRLTWQPARWVRPSTLQVTVIPQGKQQTTISFHQEKLDGAKEREEMRRHWQRVLDRLQDTIENQRGA